ncbi:MAG: hypothetical protein JO003_04105 [Candidatus Eremiobacteraeota bacterium]|nr:hypothetical protein [Candidatus Eremiobacteraeota bacterium]
MPDVRLERALRVPADPGAQALGELLDAIANQEGPWRGFALHISFGELRLPDVGYVAVPIRLQVTKRAADACSFDVTFNSMNLSAAFPTFKGTFGIEAAGLGESKLVLRGGYDIPMQIFGKFLDRTLTPGLAQRSLENFVDEIAAATQARVDKREAEFARYRFYTSNLR